MPLKMLFWRVLLMLGVIILITPGCVIGNLSRYIIETQSMAPYVTTGDEVIVDDSAYTQQYPQRGDVVILEISGERPSIKRIIGLPGEYVEIRDGHVFINGELLEEPYIEYPIGSHTVREWTLGPNEYIGPGRQPW